MIFDMGRSMPYQRRNLQIQIDDLEREIRQKEMEGHRTLQEVEILRQRLLMLKQEAARPYP